jgi:glutamate synthase domain-containing protein 3
LGRLTVRELNNYLHHDLLKVGHVSNVPGSRGHVGNVSHVEILNPNGMHSIAVGLDAPAEIDIRGHAGYFIAGMNKQANITVHGNVGWSVAENIMSGTVRVKGCASECAGASGHGGLLVIEGDASSRCGISMKGCDIVVGGSVGHMSAFMAQAGTLVVCGDAGPNLGDSLYEATVYVGGKIHSFGADAQEEPMTAADVARVNDLLTQAGIARDPMSFKRVASKRSLYHWHSDAGQEY